MREDGRTDVDCGAGEDLPGEEVGQGAQSGDGLEQRQVRIGQRPPDKIFSAVALKNFLEIAEVLGHPLPGEVSGAPPGAFTGRMCGREWVAAVW